MASAFVTIKPFILSVEYDIAEDAPGGHKGHFRTIVLQMSAMLFTLVFSSGGQGCSAALKLPLIIEKGNV